MDEADELFLRGKAALKRKDFDAAVWDFFKAVKSGFGDKKYHKAFANSLRKRGLTKLKTEDEQKAEALYQKAKADRSIESQDMFLEAALLGHLDSAAELRTRYIIAVSTTPEGNALHNLLVKANHPPTLCKEAHNYSWHKGGYHKKKAMEYFKKAAALGYEPAEEIIENIRLCDIRDKEKMTAEREFAKKNPPLEGEERKKYEEELKKTLCAISRKANIFKPEKQKTPLPSEQILSSHVGGVPYFEEGGKWPCNREGEPFTFVLQVFQDSESSLVLPDGIKLLQIFLDFNEEEEHVVIKHELNTEKAVFIDSPEEEKIPYMALTFKNINMLPDYHYLSIASPEVMSLAEKIHPGKGEFVVNRLLKNLKFKEHDTDSYLGGFFGDLSNSSLGHERRKSTPFFQLYLDRDDEGFYGWKRWDDAMLYATYDEKNKKACTELVINYD